MWDGDGPGVVVGGREGKLFVMLLGVRAATASRKNRLHGVPCYVRSAIGNGKARNACFVGSYIDDSWDVDWLG